MGLTITTGGATGVTTGVSPGTYGSSGASAPAQSAATAKTTNSAPVSQPVLQDQGAAEANKPQETSQQTAGKTSQHRDAVTITYDSLAGVAVFKSFDRKGNLVTQAPPVQLLKTMELEGKTQEEIKGQVINTKV